MDLLARLTASCAHPDSPGPVGDSACEVGISENGCQPRSTMCNAAVFTDGIRPRFLAINPQPTRNIGSGLRTASELSANMELARLITAKNDHVDLIGNGVEQVWCPGSFFTTTTPFPLLAKEGS